MNNNKKNEHTAVFSRGYMVLYNTKCRFKNLSSTKPDIKRFAEVHITVANVSFTF